jgi:hypothetical protein
MKSWEVLARGSAVSVAMKDGASPVFLTSGRTAAPFNWQRLFPAAEWLKHVRHEHCRYILSVPGHSFELAADSLLHHPSLDVAAMSLEPQVEKEYAAAGGPILSSRLDSGIASEGLDVVMHGWSVNREENNASIDETTRLFEQTRSPVSETGVVLSATAERGLVRTKQALSPGVSGGGVFDCGDDPRLLGIWEGPLISDGNDDGAGSISGETPVFFSTFVAAAEIRRWLSGAAGGAF